MDADLEKWCFQQRLARLGGAFPFGIAGAYNGTCEHCGDTTTVAKAPCRTAYADEKLNIPGPALCFDCTDEYNDFWDEMWSNVGG